MKIDIIDLDKFVEINECPQITDPVMFESGRTPTSGGVFSYELFGRPGTYDRKTIFGYIDLKDHFLHPVVYKVMKSMDKRIPRIIDGSLYVKLNDKGYIEEDPENGETGLPFLYKNYNKLKFPRTGSPARNEKIAFLETLKRNEAFCSKWLVIPPFYRDVRFSKSAGEGSMSHDPVNRLYTKLLGLTNSLGGETFDFVGNMTRARIQLTLEEIYDYFSGYLEKKRGYLRDRLLSKAIDYASRSVISAPRINSETWDTQRIPFTHTGIPLAQICALFFPFMVRYIREFLADRLEGIGRYIWNHTKTKRYEIENPMEQFGPDEISRMMNLYITSPLERFSKIYITTKEGKRLPLGLYYEDLKRYFTITDLLYIAAYDVTADKHVYVTRYPVEHHQNIFPSKIKVLSTVKTKVQKLGDRVFEDYPDIYPEYPVEESIFIDTTLVNNSYLAALGGDYDGDMVSIRGVYSQEANAEAERIIFSKKNLLDANGKNIRTIGNEAILTLYSLTKEPVLIKP